MFIDQLCSFNFHWLYVLYPMLVFKFLDDRRFFGDFDLHGAIAIITDRLLILETIVRKHLVMFIAGQTFYPYNVGTSLPIHNLMILALWML